MGSSDPVRGPERVPPHLMFTKELWIFWYGDEPNLTNILSRELAGKVPHELYKFDMCIIACC